MAGDDELHHILQHVVYGFDDASFTKHHPVIERHETLFHVRAKTCHNMYAVISQMPENRLRYISLVSVWFSKHPVSQCVNDSLIAVVHIGAFVGYINFEFRDR